MFFNLFCYYFHFSGLYMLSYFFATTESKEMEIIHDFIDHWLERTEIDIRYIKHRKCNLPAKSAPKKDNYYIFI